MKPDHSLLDVEAVARAGVGTWRWDRPSGRVEWSPRAEELFGLAPGTFSGTFEGWVESLHPDDREPVVSLIQRAVESGEDHLRFEHRCIWPDTSTHWLECRGTLLKHAGEVTGASGVVFDVDSRRAAENERAQILESERAARRSAEAAWRRLTLLHDLALRLAGASRLDDVGEVLVSEGSAVFGADAGFFSTVDWEHEEIALRATRGVGPHVREYYRSVAFDSSNPVAQVVRSGSPIFVTSDDERQQLFPDLPYQGAAAFVIMPLTVRGETGAVLAFGFIHSHSFSSDERELLATIAGMTSQAVHRAHLNDATERAALRATLLERLLAERSAVEIAALIVDEVLAAVRAEAGGVYVVDDEARLARALALRGYPDGRTETSLDTPGPLVDAVRTQRPVFIERPEEWHVRYPTSRDHLWEEKAAAAHLPMVVEGATIAVLSLRFAADRRFDAAQRENLLISAAISAEALARALALEEAQIAHDRLRSIDAITDTALSQLSLDELLEQLPARLAEASSSDVVRILLQEGSQLRERGRFGPVTGPPVVVPIGEGLSGRVAQAGRPAVIPDITRHEVVHPAFPEEVTTVAGVPMRSGGRIIGVLDVGAGPDRRFTERDIELLELAADRMAVAIDRTRALEMEQVQSRRSQYLERLAAAVEESGQFETLVDEMAHVTLGDLADWCVLTMAPELGVSAVIPAHRDRSMLGLVEQFIASEPFQAIAALGVSVLASGSPERLTGDHHLFDEIDESEAGELVDALDLRQAVIVPLRSPSTAVGTMLLVRTGRGKDFTDDDLDLAVDLGERIGAAIESRRSFERHREAALALQRSLLPAGLPDTSSLEVAVRYWPGSDQFDVGGDFYDVIDLGPGRLGILVGDVSGKGMAAAAMTGIARHTARAAATHGFEPDEVLRWIHDAFLTQNRMTEMFCSGVYGVLEVEGDDARFRFAIGGHPLPAFRSGDDVQFVGTAGTVLGLIDPISLTISEVSFRRGDWLVLYTDGVTDVPVADAVTEAELLEIVRDVCRGTPDEALSSLEGVLSERYGHVASRDDTAVLAIKFVGETS